MNLQILSKMPLDQLLQNQQLLEASEQQRLGIGSGYTQSVNRWPPGEHTRNSFNVHNPDSRNSQRTGLSGSQVTGLSMSKHAKHGLHSVDKSKNNTDSKNNTGGGYQDTTRVSIGW